VVLRLAISGGNEPLRNKVKKVEFGCCRESSACYLGGVEGKKTMNTTSIKTYRFHEASVTVYPSGRWESSTGHKGKGGLEVATRTIAESPINITVEKVKAGSMTREVSGTYNGRPFNAYRGKAMPSGNYQWRFRFEKWSDWTERERRLLTRAMNRSAIKRDVAQKANWKEL